MTRRRWVAVGLLIVGPALLLGGAPVLMSSVHAKELLTGPGRIIEAVAGGLAHRNIVDRGWLGVAVQDVDPGLARVLAYKGTAGAVVANVASDSPAERAGVRQGDIVTEFDGKPVKDARALAEEVASVHPDTPATVELFRAGRKQTVNIEVGVSDTFHRHHGAFS